MRESKSKLTDRLRLEGRFEAFKKRREELKDGGVPAKQAWFEAAVEFPPAITLPPPRVSSRPFTKTDFRAISRKACIKIGQAIRWAFDHLEGDWLQPRDAPSIGAWSLREWARSSPTARTEFYRLFAAKMSSIPSEDMSSPQRMTKRDREFYEQMGMDPRPHHY
jgi:hypothetical protein